MAIALTNDQYYSDIASAIRGKNGEETTYKPSEMASAIKDIPSGGFGVLDHTATFKDIDGNIVNISTVNDGIAIDAPSGVDADYWENEETEESIAFPLTMTDDITILAIHVLSNYEIICKMQEIDCTEYDKLIVSDDSAVSGSWSKSIAFISKDATVGIGTRYQVTGKVLYCNVDTGSTVSDKFNSLKTVKYTYTSRTLSAATYITSNSKTLIHGVTSFNSSVEVNDL